MDCLSLNKLLFNVFTSPDGEPDGVSAYTHLIQRGLATKAVEDVRYNDRTALFQADVTLQLVCPEVSATGVAAGTSIKKSKRNAYRAGLEKLGMSLPFSIHGYI